ncbi:galactosylceramide sulfotransferase-like [Saccoglossus kowalevskii]|uniref:Galactosylceramide sulfotransferase-like n=1 Tax=Saccoglossus kowalevskii TaxID=10224 RepID=A0ABM0MT47_SACKO|nr:PREDICTED: galactosylceramide sulfotransferase-like [Saccoglossus kowalevskii]
MKIFSRIAVMLVCCIICVYEYMSLSSNQSRNKKDLLLKIGHFPLSTLSQIQEHEYTERVHMRSHRDNDSYIQVSTTKPGACEPYKYFIFVKTAKTGGSTIASLLYRYGINTGLVAAIPDPPAKFMLRVTSSEVQATQYSCSETGFPGYNYIASHLHRYNFNSLKNFLPRAKFITILRSPVDTFVSRFYFSNVYKMLGLQNKVNPLQTFLTDSAYRDIKEKVIVPRVPTWFSLTHDHRISEVSKEFDLVMITEYMDESLILLKKMMCWTFDDIIYHSKKVSGVKRPSLSNEMRELIEEGLHLDIEWYDHFNKTLWDKIKNYDGDFNADLSLFRLKLSESEERCRKNRKDDEDYCKFLSRDVGQLKKKLAKQQYERFCGKQFTRAMLGNKTYKGKTFRKRWE